MEQRKGAPKQSVRRRFFASWKRFGKKVADVQARILLSIFYFIILAPFALVLRLVADPLAIKSSDKPRGWNNKDLGEGNAAELATRQF